MHEVESFSSAMMSVQAIPGQALQPPVQDDDGGAEQSLPSDGPGALDRARKQLTEALGGTGFVDIAGPQNQNFKTFLNRGPVDLQMDDLKPGTLVELMAWVTQKLALEPERATQAQARIRPEVAVKLLT